jgi:hypothetical protein
VLISIHKRKSVKKKKNIFFIFKQQGKKKIFVNDLIIYNLCEINWFLELGFFFIIKKNPRITNKGKSNLQMVMENELMQNLARKFQ